MQVRGQAFNELQYIALNLIESTIHQLDFSGYLPAIQLFTRDESDARTVLKLLEQTVVVIGFDQDDEDENEEEVEE